MSHHHSLPHHKTIHAHPSDRLIPCTNVHPMDRLPMVPYVERDENRAGPVYPDDLTMHDVLLGRGAMVNKNSGNIRFRKIVSHYQNAYGICSKGAKGQLARNICNYVRLLGGRFLEKCNIRDSDGPCWQECGDTRAHAKCSQALRESTTTTRTTSKQTIAASRKVLELSTTWAADSQQRATIAKGENHRFANSGSCQSH